MTGERSYVRVPPDSTGKKVRHEPFHRVGYNNRQNNHVWQLEREYQITGSVNITVVIFTGPNSDSGYVGMKLPGSSEFNNVDLQAGDLIVYEGTTVATITSDEIISIPYVQISGGNSPNETVNVDRTGSMSMRFDEGRPQLDAFGRLRVSSGTTLGDYVFAYDELPNNFSTTLRGNGSASHDDDKRALLLEIDAGTPGQPYDPDPNLDQVSHTTDTYHHYFPGFSHEAIMTVALGNITDNAGATRNWGYFDANNGYMFRHTTGTDEGEFYLVIRATGIRAQDEVDEIRISKTQTERWQDVRGTPTLVETIPEGWNVDPVDSSGESQMNLDLTKDNIYWVDVQWLGAGRVRFGTYHRGQRVVIHEHYHEGVFNQGNPTSQSGSLPLCFSMVNTATLLAPITMRVWCAAVHTEHEVTLGEVGNNRLETITKTNWNPASLENGQEYELIGSLSPVKTLDLGSTGDKNRTLYLPNYMECMAYHANGDPALVEFEIYLDPVMGGGNVSFPINADEFVVSPGQTPWLVNVDQRLQNAVEVYKPDNYNLADRPKFWGGGLHLISAFTRGENRLNLSDTYTNFQDGAFKNYAENGGIQDHVVGSFTLSANSSVTTSYTAGGPQLFHREGYPVRFYDVTGTAANVLNYADNGGQDFYIRITSKTTAELYTDIEFSTIVDTSGLTVTAPGRMRADYGDQMYFVSVVKPLQPAIDKYNSDPANLAITAHFNLGWSEINQ